MSPAGAGPARRRRLWGRVALVCCGLAGGLVGGELVCRIAANAAGAGSPPPVHGQELLRLSADPHRGWELRPAILDHNAAGFRGAPVPAARTPGVTRIVAAGDSVTYGVGVGADETFAAVLESLLNRRVPGGYEVLNFGVPGYATNQVRRLLEDRLPRYAPDIVVLTFTPDDVETSPVVIDVGGEPCLFANQLEGRWPFDSRLHWWVFQRSCLYRLLYKSLALMLVRSAVPGEEVFVDPAAAWRNVARTRALVEHHGARLILVLSPPVLPVFGPEGRPIETPAVITEPLAEIRRRALSSGVEVLDLEPLFAPLEGRLKLSADDHEHFNARGHQLVAAALAKMIGHGDPPIREPVVPRD